jgi:L-seryl-tRNA(Ser) seleniumtransferase
MRTKSGASAAPDIFARVGVRPVINGCGIYSDLGGSRLSPSIWAAMGDMNEHFVSMVELLRTSGEIIAHHVGAEAARVTPGAAASIMLMVAGVLTGKDASRTELLPRTEGLRDEIVLQWNHRYKYDRQIAMTGARIVRVGGGHGTTADEVRQALTPRTAAFFLPAHLNGVRDTVPLVEFVALAREAGAPTLVDAAYQCWPLENFRKYSREGADLVCFSAKYFGGPNAGGFVAGRRDLVDAIADNDFTRYESGRYRKYGRPLKLDRHTVVATVLALEEWLAMDHGERWAAYGRMVANLRRRLAAVRGIRLEERYFTMDERLVPEPVNSLVVEVDPSSGTNAAAVAARLAEEMPSILVNVEADRLIVCVDALHEGEETIIADRLRDALEENRSAETA